MLFVMENYWSLHSESLIIKNIRSYLHCYYSSPYYSQKYGMLDGQKYFIYTVGFPYI